jgi:hypothetical protein
MGSRFKTKLMSAEAISMLGLRGRMVLWVIVLIVVGGVWCEDSSLPETVRTLKAQVSALLEDFALLAKNSELLELREELAALRYVKHAVRSRSVNEPVIRLPNSESFRTCC